MRLIILPLLVLLLPGIAFSQSDTDSIRTQLEKYTHQDTVRVELMNDLAFALRFKSPDSTILLSDSAIILAKKLGYQPGAAMAVDNKGLAFLNTGRYDSAELFFKNALEISESAAFKRGMASSLNNLGIINAVQNNDTLGLYYFKASLKVRVAMGDKKNIAYSMNNIGMTYKNKGNFPEALDYFQQAMATFMSLQDKQGLLTVYTNTGIVYKQLEEFDKAVKYYNKALEICKALNNEAELANINNNLGNIYSRKGQLDKALSFYYQSLEIRQKLGQRCFIAAALSNIGSAYHKLSKPDSAMINSEKALKAGAGCNYKAAMILSQITIGNIWMERGNFSQSEKYLSQALRIAKSGNLQFQIKDAHKSLYELYQKKRDYKKAFDHLTSFHAANDSLFNEANNRKVARLEADYKLEQEKQRLAYEKEKEILTYNEKIDRQHLLQQITFGGILLLTIALAIIGKFYRGKQKDNQELLRLNNEISERNHEIVTQNEQIKKQRDRLDQINKEKNTLIGVVAHDLRSPLNQIKGMAYLTKLEPEGLNDNQQEYLSKMIESADRLSAMISRVLDINAIEADQVNLKIELTKLNTLIDGIVTNFKVLADEKEIKLHFSQPEIDIFAKVDKNYLIQIIENLVSNAIKFSPENTNVFLKLETVGEVVQLKVEDEGPGISKDDQQNLFKQYAKLSARPTAGEESSGLGLSIAKKYVQAMRGRIWCESELGKGAVFFLEFDRVAKLKDLANA